MLEKHRVVGKEARRKESHLAVITGAALSVQTRQPIRKVSGDEQCLSSTAPSNVGMMPSRCQPKRWEAATGQERRSPLCAPALLLVIAAGCGEGLQDNNELPTCDFWPWHSSREVDTAIFNSQARKWTLKGKRTCFIPLGRKWIRTQTQDWVQTPKSSWLVMCLKTRPDNLGDLCCSLGEGRVLAWFTSKRTNPMAEVSE